MTYAQVVFLNGASSSGKSTLAKALQGRLEKPYLHIAEDMFFDALPKRELPQADFLRYGMRLYRGFAQCVRTLADCDNWVIVDTVAWVPGCMAEFASALWDLRVCAVGVHCPLATLEAREQQRGNRSLGLARQQFEAVHREALYDVEVDTERDDLDRCVERIVAAMQTLPSPHAFARLHAGLPPQS